MAAQSRPVAGVAIVAIAASMFGMLGPVTRFAYATGIDPLSYIAWRSLVGMVATGGFVAWRVSRQVGGDRWPVIDRRAWLGLLGASVGAMGVNVGLFLAFQRLPVALALLAFYTYPALVAIVAIVLGREAMDRWRAVALGLASAGMVGVVAGGSGGIGGPVVDLSGILLALLAAAAQTLFVTVAREGYRSVPTDIAMTGILGFVGLVGGAAAIMVAGWDAFASPAQAPNALGLLLFAGLFTAAIPSLLFLAGIRRLGGLRAGILMLLEPVVGVLLAAWLLSEPVGPIQLAGGLAILAAAVILERAPMELLARSRLRPRRLNGERMEAEAGRVADA
jgi:drug/metabolite transporter (DMT)-like permease